ncbi:hypothetical protein [Paracoccus sp. Ld10]|uniref:hypothetical protein n=1 Tax=Paracoccus sp. Ld10 TaxID=649158 RepID=UPI00386EE6DA
MADSKPHFIESYAAAAWFWQAYHLAEGQDLNSLSDWPPAARKRFASAAVTRIAALRKAREYDSSDGLAIWMHTARALSEPQMVPAVRTIWQYVQHAPLNADTMAQDLIDSAGLTYVPGRRIPDGFGPDD